jgi:hypothetical protein
MPELRAQQRKSPDGGGAADGPVLLGADRVYDAVLGPSDHVFDRPFTDPESTVSDALVMSDLLARERAIALTWPRGAPGPGISEKLEAGTRRFLAVPDGANLLTSQDVTAVGFFGHLRDGVDHAILFELEAEVAQTFPAYASVGFLSYFDIGPEHGRYGNLILFSTPDVPDEWHANPAHRRAVSVAGQHYDHVRLHKGRISGPFLNGADPRLERTMYLDFAGEQVWRGVRLYEGGGLRG